MNRHWKKTVLIALLIAIAVGVVPVYAHAACWWSFSGIPCSLPTSPADIVLQLILSLVEFVQSILLKLVLLLSSLMNFVVGIRADGGGLIVYSSWRILRDFCNMVFIIVIILTSFGTIFNTFQFVWLKPYSIYNKQLLGGFLAAAIFMNFSLAIGQTIVGFSNKATTIMTGLIGNTHIGDTINQNLDLKAIALRTAPSSDPANPAAAITTRQTADGLSLAEQQAADIAWQKGILRAYLKCINGNAGDQLFIDPATAAQCMNQVVDNNTNKLPWLSAATTAQNLLAAKTPPDVIAVHGAGNFAFKDTANAALVSASEGAPDASIKNSSPFDPDNKLTRIMGDIYSIFLLLVLALSFLVPIVFMVVRIPMIWIILVLSPLAWVGLMFPTSKAWEQWWAQFMAWNIFTPLYLFMIYFGLYMISQHDVLLAQLSKSGFIDQQLGNLMFYVMTGIIFVFGSAKVVNIAFAGGKSFAASAFGSISGGLGIKGEAGAIGAVYRGTGLETRVTGAGKGISSVYENRIAAPLRRGGEEAGARYQARFGDRGALEALERKRIKEQSDKLKERGLASSDIKKEFNESPAGSAKYFAAADALLSEGKLNAKEMLAYQTAASKVSPSFSNAVREKVEKKLKDTGKEKQFKYKDTKEVLAALDQYKQDPKKPKDEAQEKMRDDILKKVEQTQPLLAGELANAGLYINPNGTKKTPEQIIEGGFKGMGNKDILTLLDQEKAGKIQITPAMQTLLAERTKKLENYLDLINSATPEQQIDIAHIVALKEQVAKTKQQKGKKKKSTTP